MSGRELRTTFHRPSCKVAVLILYADTIAYTRITLPRHYTKVIAPEFHRIEYATVDNAARLLYQLKKSKER